MLSRALTALFLRAGFDFPERWALNFFGMRLFLPVVLLFFLEGMAAVYHQQIASAELTRAETSVCAKDAGRSIKYGSTLLLHSGYS